MIPTKNNTSTNSQQALLSLVEKFANRFFALLVAIICIVAFFLGPRILPAYKDVFISVSTSLFASLIFALIYSSVVEQHHLTVVNDALSQSVHSAVGEMKQLQNENLQNITNLMVGKIEEIEKSYYHEISLHFRELIPSDYFPPLNQPDKRFNSLLNASLSNSHLYLFKGVTGRHIPARLSIADHHNLNCKILLIDPNRQDLLRLYVRDRFGTTAPSSEVAKRIQRVKQETYMTIVDLFDQARWTSVEIKLYSGSVFYRTEIFDDKIFISYFTAKTPTAYPTTYLYGKDSFFYNVFLTDFYQTFELSPASIVFNSSSTEQDLIHFLTKIGCDVGELSELRMEAEQFRRDFLGKM